MNEDVLVQREIVLSTDPQSAVPSDRNGGYYRKRDLLISAEIRDDGAIVGPAVPRMEIRPFIRRDHPTTSPQTQPSKATQPSPILVIPKDQMDKPLNPEDREMY